MSQLIIKQYLDEFGYNGQTMLDLAFDNLAFLNAKEPVLDLKGQRISKSYYDKKGKEAVRITYEKIYGTHIYKEVEYTEQFLGCRKTISFMDWGGEIGYSKEMQGYLFNLEPVFLGDGNETVLTFSSAKQRQILKQERYAADDMLNAKNPLIYAFLFERYSYQYQYYLRTGLKENLESAIVEENDPAILAKLNHLVYGSDLTVRELILNCLQ